MTYDQFTCSFGYESKCYFESTTRQLYEYGLINGVLGVVAHISSAHAWELSLCDRPTLTDWIGHPPRDADHLYFFDRSRKYRMVFAKFHPSGEASELVKQALEARTFLTGQSNGARRRKINKTESILRI